MPPHSEKAFRTFGYNSFQWRTRKITIGLSHRITRDKESRGAYFDTCGSSSLKYACHRPPCPPSACKILKGTPTSPSKHAHNDACGLNHKAIEDELCRALSALDTAKENMTRCISEESALTDQVECYRRENNRLFQENEVKDIDLARASITIEDLTKEVDALRKYRDQVLEENRGLQKSLEHAGSSLKDAMDTLSDKEAQAEAYRIENQRLHEENRRLASDYSELSDTHRKVAESNALEQDLLQCQGNSYREKSDVLGEENTFLVESLQLTDAMLLDARTTIAVLKQANEELDSLYSSAVDDATDLTIRLHICEDQLASAMKGMRLQEAEWTSKVAEADLRLRTESSRLKSLIVLETDEKLLAHAELDNLRKERSSTLAETDSLRTDLEKVKLILKRTERSLMEAQSAKQTLNARIEGLNGVVKEAHKAGKDLKKKLQQSQSQTSTLSSQKDDVEKKLDCVREKWKSVSHKLKDAQSQIKSLTKENASLDDQVECLQEKVLDMDCQFVEAQKRDRETIAALKSSHGRLLDENENLENRLQKAKQKKQNLRVELEDTKERLEVAEARRRSWRQELNVVQRQLRIARKHTRSLDQLSVYQFEVHQDLAGDHIKRCKNHPSSTEHSKLVRYVEDINDVIAQDAAYLSDNDYFYWIPFPVEMTKRSNHILGDLLASALKKQVASLKITKVFALMPLVLELFMVEWTSAIIDALYPKQRTFADILVALAADTPPCSSTGTCKTNNRYSTSSEPTSVISQCDRGDYSAWAKEAVDDLSGILGICGLRVKNHFQCFFTTRFISLFKDAYKIRTCIAEKDLCGNLELLVVSSDTPFQSDTMKQSSRMKAEEKQNKGKELVVGTVGLGLETIEKGANGIVPNSRVVLKPKVVISSALEYL